MADTVAVRLKKGAERLGEYWRANERCASGWSLECACPTKNRFCKAKDLWLELALIEGRDFGDGPYGLALTMKASEWDATGLVMKPIMGDAGEVRVGKGGTVSMAGLWAMRTAPEGIKGVIMVLKTFPGAMVQEVVPRESAAVAIPSSDTEAPVGP